MKSNPQKIDGLFNNLTDEELASLVKDNEDLDKEKERIIQEEREELVKKMKEKKKYSLNRLKKPPLEIINRILFFIFLGSFLFSFVSVYSVSRWWFILYIISSFSCILYTPNRKAVKELIAAWPNLEDLIKKRSLWRKNN